MTDVSKIRYIQSRGPSARTGTTKNACTTNQEDNKRTNAARVRTRVRLENEGVREDRRTKTRVRAYEQGHRTTTGMMYAQLQQQRQERDREHRADAHEPGAMKRDRGCMCSSSSSNNCTPAPTSLSAPPLPNPLYFIYIYFYLANTSSYERKQPSCSIFPLLSIIYIRNSNYSSNRTDTAWVLGQV